MSMLAEPRRKQKWSVDPRNSAWSNDDSKFGQKMLERMGWSKGKGLGKSEQGATDHIKVQVKNNGYGLGANASCEDNWIAHQDDFNELLAQLNNCHGQNSSNEPAADEQKGFSLEEKSKTSKKRVHYTKFTKGKDLSSRSETDLNCIFGKRARSTKDQEQESSSSDSQGDTEETVTPATPGQDPSCKTVTSTLTMQEYFTQRMAQLKARGQAQNPASSVVETETTCSPEEHSPINSSSDNTEVTKKKRKKKNKKDMDEVEEVKENSSAPIEVEDDKKQELEHSRKKKKKRKMMADEGATMENCNPTSGVEQNSEELPPSKKKKLKKHTKETGLIHGHAEDQSVDSNFVQKKKKKHKEKVASIEEEDQEDLVKKSSKKKKKHQQ
ncbi:PIN2/TERF1-interacting telomerase inhibitor 1 isoform X2 [Mastacembelus armatus]|uniref:PIN2 (TERF1) interacting telomerase inhibitor 1 n=1 Tax=Mastacembelus armatus TaxID=205130 RepID=A0A3Q3MYR8_9TELE|nr:PIN2/TERF1-interacting telomerase inhibitor 1 isoform X2 [Mastacembelus armatus]